LPTGGRINWRSLTEGRLMVDTDVYNYPGIERVIYGRPMAEAVAGEVGRIGAERVFLLVSGTVSRAGTVIPDLRQALGGRVAAEFDRMPAHTPRDAVIEAARVAREAGTDLIVTVGGGSVTDAGKIVQICLRHDLRHIDALEPFRMVTNRDGSQSAPKFDGPQVRQISVPTTLSGGEFSMGASCTDPRTKVKQAWMHPMLIPRSVVLDPESTVLTPQWLFLSTGVRAVDHCVEGICSTRSNPMSDAALRHALGLLTSGLPRVKADPGDLQARLDCQVGAWLSMVGVSSGVPMGASHAIGHVLGGTCNVPHGYTSCVMLPSVLAWNQTANDSRQRLVAELMGRPGEGAGRVLHEFIAGLGLPRTLSAVGVLPAQFDVVAKNVMHDRWTHTNPRRIDGPSQIVEILRSAA